MEEIGKFDEQDAITFIRKAIGPEKSNEVSDDEILYVIDCIWDWYEKNGYLEISAEITDEEALNVDALISYVTKELARAKEFLLDPSDIGDIVKAELQYEESIENI